MTYDTAQVPYISIPPIYQFYTLEILTLSLLHCNSKHFVFIIKAYKILQMEKNNISTSANIPTLKKNNRQTYTFMYKKTSTKAGFKLFSKPFSTSPAKLKKSVLASAHHLCLNFTFGFLPLSSVSSTLDLFTHSLDKQNIKNFRLCSR